MTKKESWEGCMKMWRSFDMDDEDFEIVYAKQKYCEENGLDLEHDCYFCGYVDQQGLIAPYMLNDDGCVDCCRRDTPDTERCPECPGSLIRKDFNCESTITPDWLDDH